MLRALRLTAALALVAGTAVGGLRASAAPTSCGPGGTVEDVGKGWLALRPAFTAGSPDVTLAAAPSYDTNLLWATNGTVLMRSQDAGCSWSPVWSVTSLGTQPLQTARITALSAPSSANSSDVVYLGVTSSTDLTVLSLDTPTLVVGTRRGTTFTVADASSGGLPPLGAVREVAANAQVPQDGFAVIDTPFQGSQLWATTDGGTSWAQRGAFTGSGLLAHPTIATELFAVAGGKVVRTEDGGATWSTTPSPTQVTALTTASGPRGVRLAAAVSGQPRIATSANGGDAWGSAPSPVVPASLAVVPVVADLTAVADTRTVWLTGTARAQVSPSGGAPRLISAGAPTAAGYSLVGLRDGAVLRLALDPSLKPLPPTVVNGGLHPVLLQPLRPVTQLPPLLQPAGLHVALPAGGHRRVPYRLLLPRNPTPVDVMFLIDSTSSMQPVFDGLRQGLGAITDSLNAGGLDAHFGLGDFRDYAAPYGYASNPTWAYRLDRRLGRGDARFAAAISAVQATGGTTDGSASWLAAVEQSTAGKGVRVEGDTLVEPGQQAGYRTEALRLALVASDTITHEGGDRNGMYPGGTFAQVEALTRRYHVHVVGLNVLDGNDPTGRSGLIDLAEGSRTYAPDGGVDCDGNGRPDVRAGDPLVCDLGNSGGTSASAGGSGISISTGAGGNGLTAAVVGLAANLHDMSPVSLRVEGGAATARVVTPVPVVDLHADNDLAYQLDLSCPRGPAARHRIGLVAEAGRRELVRGSIVLDCGPVPVPPVAAAVPPLAAAAAPVAPGQPAPNPNPNPNANPNPNPAPNVNANPGVASQEEAEGQLAFAEGERGNQLEMSAVRSGAFVGTAALLLCAATAVAWRRRTQEALAES